VSTILARRFLTYSLEDNRAIELRAQSPNGWISGWFDNQENLFTEISKNQHLNLYSSIHRPRGATITNRLTWDARAVRNSDIESYSRLFFDFDPERPKGQPATDIELDFALQRARGFAHDMKQRGWPSPALVMSGNGAHLHYRCGFVCDEQSKKLLPRLYRKLGEQYSDDVVTLDRSVSSPGQLARVPCTRNRKGEASTERPHRMSSVWMPKQYERLPAEAIWGLMCDVGADKEPERPIRASPGARSSGRGDYSALDIVSWFESHGLYTQPLEANKHAVTCPWAHEHSCHGGTGESIIFEPDGGWAGFFCHHSHCAGRGIRDVLEYLSDGDKFCGRRRA
jgi:hypothetical protein